MKVAAIYRVSTEKQVRRDGDDTIPVQRTAVREFVARQDAWVLVRDYAEEGVSGYKVSAENRDVLQQAFKDARAGLWQVLVVFKADRLSRNSLEYPVVLDRFHRLGVAVWSVKDAPGGKLLALDSQMDKFIRFLEGWQAETESKNTSIRVSEAMMQMAKQGKWSGGPPPYGFRLNPYRQRGSSPLALAVDPTEAEVIREMVRLYLDQRMGGKLVAEQLNGRGVTCRSGRPWSDSRVRQVLQNPIVAGLPAYNRTRPAGNNRAWKNPYDLTQFILPRDEQGNLRPVPEYRIVPLEHWLKLMKAMESNKTRRRQTEMLDGSGPAVRHALTCRSTCADAVLTGIVFCGHCGARLAADTTSYKQARKDGSITVSKRMYYVCQTHLHKGREFCDGQRTYGSRRLQTAVLDQLKALLTMMDHDELAARLFGGFASGRELAQQRQHLLESEQTKAERVLAGWLDRMDAYLASPVDSAYSEDILVEKIREARERRDGLRQQLQELVGAEEEPGVTTEQVEQFAEVAPQWWACFDQTAPREQRLLIRDLIEKIIVRRDEMEIVFKVDLQSFLPKARELAAARVDAPVTVG